MIICPKDTKSMDVLSSVLKGLEPRGQVFCRGDLSAPWAFCGEFDQPLFHAFVSGQGYVLYQDGPAAPVQAGDIVLLVRGGKQTLLNDPSSEPRPFHEAVSYRQDDPLGEISLEGGGVRTRIVCGTFAFSGARDHPLLLALPDVIVVRCGLAGWLESTLGLLYDEISTGKPGSELVATRLTEILLVSALRTYIEQNAAHASGFLAALSDAHIGHALALIHQDPARRWSVADLAQHVGMSRSAFYARFTNLVKLPPAQYVTSVGMQRAATRLIEEVPRPLIADLAGELGYGSESAFSRAFTRYHGHSPSAFLAHAASQSHSGSVQ